MGRKKGKKEFENKRKKWKKIILGNVEKNEIKGKMKRKDKKKLEEKEDKGNQRVKEKKEEK
jgi:hypothetical protein